MTVRAYIYISCNSQREKFGDITNDLFVQTGAELLDHEPLDDPTLVKSLCRGENTPSESM